MKVSGRTLGIDYGLARVGLALSDEQGLLASTLTTLHTKKEETVIQEILHLVTKYHIQTIVLGNPLQDDDQKTHMSDIIERFREHLVDALHQESLDIQVVLWNEMLTSYQAYENLLAKGYSHIKVKEILDMESARIILQEYLDQ